MMRFSALLKKTSRTSGPAAAVEDSRFADSLVSRLNGRLREPGKMGNGASVSGNTQGQPVNVKFTTANVPFRVTHSFGYTVHNWRVTTQKGDGDFTIKQSKRRPTKACIWLECTKAPVEATIVVWGDRGEEP